MENLLTISQCVALQFVHIFRHFLHSEAFLSSILFPILRHLVMFSTQGIGSQMHVYQM